EALFILTTIDTGTRVGRFLLQETLGKWVHPSFARTDWWPSAILATALISFGWWYFLIANAFNAIWAMFGIANQMLAVVALAIATAALAQSDKRRYRWITLLPMIFVAITTTSAAVLKLKQFLSAPNANNIISATCLIAILLCAVVVVGSALMKAAKPVRELQPVA
ncbi:MAG TPA: carbon starvation CstA 5TM domain-containing protein, partial [Phycisphaerae bacterium]|nr:carbon starvation CstA 5TM domain-containing protein [Phycisphaerae bacterium]